MKKKKKPTSEMTPDRLMALREELLDPEHGFEKWCIYFLDGPPDHEEFWSQSCHGPLCKHLSSSWGPDKLVVMPRGHL